MSMLKNIEKTSKTHLNNIMQIAVFNLNDSNYYGINVSKIRSFEDFKRYKLTKNSKIDSSILDGYIEYQDKIIPVLNIERWLGICSEESEYFIYLVCEFNRFTVAFPIKSIYNIYNISIQDLQKPDAYFSVVTYNTIIEIDSKDETCLVLDVEMLLHDTFGESLDIDDDMVMKKSSKKVLVAEDSRTAQEIVNEIMNKTQYEFVIFGDGADLIEHLESLSESEIGKIGLIITDLEMPRKDGYQVIKYVKQNQKLEHIPVVVNSSMSNRGVDQKTKSLGASGFVAKTDAKKFLDMVDQYILE